MNAREAKFIEELRDLIHSWNVVISIESEHMYGDVSDKTINFYSSDFDQRGQLNIDLGEHIDVEDLNNKLDE